MEITLFLVVLFAVQLKGSKAVEKNVADSKVVKTESGSVRGYKLKDNNVYAFYGVPYATTPTGSNKFKAPLPAPIWLDTLDAVDDSIICPQLINEELSYFSKDQITTNCLIANVFIPDTKKTNLPVVVYVHGGGYLMGSGNAVQPKILVESGEIIAVSFNYRLGVHGFLCLGTENVPGNAGMKDQVALLRWVKKNIASFGGNPDDITLAGNSAGGSAVELLAISEMARGLFKKVIPESGAGVAVWSIQQDPIALAKSFAESMNFKSEDVNALEQFYINASDDIGQLFNMPDSNFGFVPCIERDTGTEAFLKDVPVTILKKKEFKKLPMLIGFAKMEGILRTNLFSIWKNAMNKKFSDFLPADLTFKNEFEKENVADIVKKFYFGDKTVSKDNMQSYIDYFGDVIFAYPALKSVRLQVEAGNDQIYLYEYSFFDEALDDILNPYKVKGANHCAQSFEIQESIFFVTNDSMLSENHKQMRAMMKQLWINFIKTGKPVPEPTANFPEGWSPSILNDSPYMDLNIPPILKKSLLQERFDFWDRIYDKYYRIPVPPPSTTKQRTDL